MAPVVSRAALERAGEQLDARLGRQVGRNVALAPMTTYRVGGEAALFVDVAGVEELSVIADVRASTSVPVLVIGRGSNMLVADQGYAGIAVSIAGMASDIDLRDDARGAEGPHVIAAGGGVALPVLARRTAAAGLTGFEWAVGVPGSIGGAVRMNAGGHGSDIANSLVDVDVFDLDRPGQLLTRPAEQLELRFRASSMSPTEIVTRVRLRLAIGDREASEAEIAEIVRWRRDHQPGGQNCGSVFVNPVPGEVTAGGLIDSLGLRGFSIGSASVSEKHANFIQATADGKAADVRAVIEAVRQRVHAETGFLLRSEVRLVGFGDTDPLAFGDRVGD